MIIGISGKKGYGKDTLAKHIQFNNKSFEIKSFADKLKNVVSEVFDKPLKDLYSLDGKERPYIYLINIDDYIEALSDKLKIKISPLGLVAKSNRELLQFVGTDYVRQNNPNYWVDNLLLNAPENEKIIVPDVRFYNECVAIRNKGGFLINVLRFSSNVVNLNHTTTLHASENSITQTMVDVNLSFVFNDFYLHELVSKLVFNNNFDSLKLLNFDNLFPALHEFKLGKYDVKSLRLNGFSENIIENLIKYYSL